MEDWEAHFAHAHYQYAALASELGLSHRTLRRHMIIACQIAPHRWLEPVWKLRGALRRGILAVAKAASSEHPRSGL